MDARKLKADGAEGRVISMSFYIRLTPSAGAELGHTDAATAIGHGLMDEAMQLLKAAAEAEGFQVFIEVTQRVY